MKTDIIIAGVGGQGIISIAAVIGYTAVSSGLYMKQSEVHGMSQRGGEVQSHLRISDEYIYSDLIPKGKAHVIISVEPMEALRYLPWLSEDGWVVTNTKPYVNIPNYPGIDLILREIEKMPNHIALNAEQTARQLNTPKSANMVMLGAASPFVGLPFDKLRDAIKIIFGKKGELVVSQNIKALNAGKEFAEKYKLEAAEYGTSNL